MSTPGAAKKAEKDKTRPRQGNIHQKRIHVLENPTKLAFKGWQDVPDPWNFDQAKHFIEWCHLDKSFRKERHNNHRHQNKANLRHCTNAAFLERCVQIYQVLYDKPKPERNEVPLYLCRGVHVEVILNKRFDWSTVKGMGTFTIPHPHHGIIPHGVYRHGQQWIPPSDDVSGALYSEASEPDDDSDGTREARLPAEKTQRKHKRKRNQRLQQEIPIDPLVGVVQPGGGVAELEQFIGEGVDLGQHVPVDMEFVVPDVDTDIAMEERFQEPNFIVDGRDVLISTLTEENQKLKEDVQMAHEVNALQQRRIEELELLIKGKEVATSGNPSDQIMESPADSLAFDRFTIETVHENNDDQIDLRARVEELEKEKEAIVSQYYQWKLACIFTVDRAKQLSKEIDTIDYHYLKHNQERVFGLTSWAHPDDMFQEDMETVKLDTGARIVDWSKHGWDYKNTTKRKSTSREWPAPADFVENGYECAVCNQCFGPEGGMAVGTCKDVFHPYCLLSLMVVRRRCPYCKAPFHERLYDLFGVREWMPPHWEYNKENLPDRGCMWGQDLIWSWKLKCHGEEKQKLGKARFGWETDPEQIVEVCHSLVPSKGAALSEGKRRFFFQCFRGHWDEEAKKFCFGNHPQGLRWKSNGEMVGADGWVQDPLEPDEDELLQFDESDWKSLWERQAVDFLFEKHSPNTGRILQAMKDSDFLKAVLEEDGPARRTRSAVRRLQLGPAEVGEHDSEANPSGAGSSEAGPSEAA